MIVSCVVCAVILASVCSSGFSLVVGTMLSVCVVFCFCAGGISDSVCGISSQSVCLCTGTIDVRSVYCERPFVLFELFEEAGVSAMHMGAIVDVCLLFVGLILSCSQTERQSFLVEGTEYIEAVLSALLSK